MSQSDDEWQRLNAFVDGEVSQGERERLRQRIRVDPLFAVQVVGLRQLKADIRSGKSTSALRPRLQFIVAAAVAVLLGIGMVWVSGRTGLGERSSTADVVAGLGAALVSTNDRAGSAPGVNAVPALDLGPAGFKLVSLVISPTTRAPMLVYEGAHGCRVGLTVTGGAELPPGLTQTNDAAARTWAVDGRTFTLVTRSMDPERFTHLAAAVEMLVRGGDDERIAVAFQRSSRGRTCLG